MTDDRLLYFAYGSNMCTRYLCEYCPRAEPAMRAALANFRIEFRRFSTNLGGGISTIQPAPGEIVHGVLFAIPRAEIEALDILENVPDGLYTRDTFLMLDAAGAWRRAELYRIVTPEGPFAPAEQYIDWMLEGAREHGLPDDYLARIAGFRGAS